MGEAAHDRRDRRRGLGRRPAGPQGGLSGVDRDGNGRGKPREGIDQADGIGRVRPRGLPGGPARPRARRRGRPAGDIRGQRPHPLGLRPAGTGRLLRRGAGALRPLRPELPVGLLARRGRGSPQAHQASSIGTP
jgi:hypothetical protein